MFDIQFFEEQTAILNPIPRPVKPLPEELINNVLTDGYLKEEEGEARKAYKTGSEKLKFSR
jgi:hypothetical protein